MKDLSEKKVFLFDHDGTLVDSEGVYHQLWCELLGPLGEQFSLAMYKEHCVGVPVLGNAQYLKQQFSLEQSPEELITARRTLTEHYLATQPFPLMPRVVAILALLRMHNKRLAIVSGSEHSAVERSVSGHHLATYFEGIYTGEQVQRNKPAPDVYLHCMAQMGVTADNCIAIEDTEHGIAAAVAAGIDTIAIPNDFTQHHNLSDACLVLSSMNQLAELL